MEKYKRYQIDGYIAASLGDDHGVEIRDENGGFLTLIRADIVQSDQPDYGHAELVQQAKKMIDTGRLDWAYD